MFVGIVKEIGGLTSDAGLDKVKQVSLGMQRQRLHVGNVPEDETDKFYVLDNNSERVIRQVNINYDRLGTHRKTKVNTHVAGDSSPNRHICGNGSIGDPYSSESTKPRCYTVAGERLARCLMFCFSY